LLRPFYQKSTICLTHAIPHARRWLAIDNLDEPAHRTLMELYARTDQLAVAYRQDQECCRLLDQAFGVTHSQLLWKCMGPLKMYLGSDRFIAVKELIK